MERAWYRDDMASRLCTPPNPSNIVQSTTTITNVLPLLVHAHCTAALPISAVDCLGDIGIASIVSPAISFISTKTFEPRCQKRMASGMLVQFSDYQNQTNPLAANAPFLKKPFDRYTLYFRASNLSITFALPCTAPESTQSTYVVLSRHPTLMRVPYRYTRVCSTPATPVDRVVICKMNKGAVCVSST